jgi:hypothetical protein
MVLVGAADFFNETMDSESFEDERDLSTCFAEKGTKPSVGESTDIELAT